MANLLLETVELHHLGIALENLDLVAFRSSAPVCPGDITRLESDCIAATSGLPTEAGFRESAFAALLGQVQVDVIEALPVIGHLVSSARPVCDMRCDGNSVLGGVFHDGITYIDILNA